MTSKSLLAIVRGGRIDNVSPNDGRSYAQVRGLLKYLAYGSYAETLGQEPGQRGIWLDQKGQSHSHQAVRQWAKESVHRLGYEHAYQLLLSTRFGGLSAADFNQVLQKGSSLSQVLEWRFMIHEDTDNQHAHAILFRQEKLNKAQYRAWQQTMQYELGQRQREQQTLEQQETLELNQSVEGSQDQSQHLDRMLDYV